MKRGLLPKFLRLAFFCTALIVGLFSSPEPPPPPPREVCHLVPWIADGLSAKTVEGPGYVLAARELFVDDYGGFYYDGDGHYILLLVNDSPS